MLGLITSGKQLYHPDHPSRKGVLNSYGDCRLQLLSSSRSAPAVASWPKVKPLPEQPEHPATMHGAQRTPFHLDMGQPLQALPTPELPARQAEVLWVCSRVQLLILPDPAPPPTSYTDAVIK